MAKGSLKYNTAVLTVTGFLVKVIGFLYRIFIANAIGSEGLGLYQLVTPIYALLVLVLSAGIQVAISRYVAEQTGKHPDSKGMKVVHWAAGIIFFAGIIICSILLLNIDMLALNVAGDIRTRRSLILTFLLVPPLAAGSAYKGYFYGKQEILPNSIGQILEQITKLVFILYMYRFFEGKGIESLCLLAVMAMLAGEFANIFVVFITFQYNQRKRTNNTALQFNEKTRSAFVKICKTAVPISTNRLILSVIGTAESLIIPKRLLLYGLSFQESLKSFGRISGMASPLVFFPSMLPAALATALVPAIAGAVATRNYLIANRQISQSIRLTLVFGLVFTSFFATCSHEIAELIYPGEGVGEILYLLSFTGIFLYLKQTMLGVLNGLGKESAILLNTFIGSLASLFVIWFAIPMFGVPAYIYAVIIGSIITVSLNFRIITKITGISIDVGHWILKPLTAALLGSLLALILKRLPELWELPEKLSMVFSVGITGFVIAAVFLVTGIVKLDDIKRLTGRKYNSIIFT